MSPKKHILLMSSWYPTRVDPHSGNFVKRFAELLSKEYIVTVLFTRSENRNDIEIVETFDSFQTIVVYHPEGKNTLDKFLTQKRVIHRAFEKVTKPVDLIFGHVIWPKGLQFLEAKKFFKAPLLLLEHASYYRTNYQLDTFQRFVIKKCLKRADSVAAVSEILKKDIENKFGIPDIYIIPNPVDESIFYFAEQGKKRDFIHISTLDPAVKHVDRILHAIHLLKKQSISATLLIISDQPYEHLQQLCKQLEIEKLVAFTGPLNSMEIADEIRQSGALVVSSSYETFGIVIAEAWLCGKPVISTPVGIASELEFPAGISTDFDEESIANNMSSFLTVTNIFEPAAILKYGKPYGSATVLKLLNEHITRLT